MKLLNNEYKRNHTIPKSIIDSWASYKIDYRNQWGVELYMIMDKKIKFSYGFGKKAYSFAIVNDIYIPSINEIRNGKLECFFSDLEGALITFIKSIESNTILESAIKTIVALKSGED